MKCPICERNFKEDSVDGCECEYNSKMLERIGTLLEYHGQRMITQGSYILAVVIGFFSIINLAKLEMPLTILGIAFYLSPILFFGLSVFGLYEVYRLKESHYLNKALEEMMMTPYNFVSRWKEANRQARAKRENEIVTFAKFLATEKERKRGDDKLTPKKEKYNTRFKWLMSLFIHYTLHGFWIYLWFTFFVVVVFLRIYFL